MITLDQLKNAPVIKWKDDKKEEHFAVLLELRELPSFKDPSKVSFWAIGIKEDHGLAFVHVSIVSFDFTLRGQDLIPDLH